jgi:hypothetical protein
MSTIIKEKLCYSSMSLNQNNPKVTKGAHVEDEIQTDEDGNQLYGRKYL